VMKKGQGLIERASSKGTSSRGAVVLMIPRNSLIAQLSCFILQNNFKELPFCSTW